MAYSALNSALKDRVGTTTDGTFQDMLRHWTHSNWLPVVVVTLPYLFEFCVLLCLLCSFISNLFNFLFLFFSLFSYMAKLIK